MLGDDPPYLSVGTEVSAKYKGAFCEAKIRKVVRSVKCRVTYKQGLGTATVADDQIKGTLRVGAAVEAKHGDRKEYVEATITKIQDCSQYTVVFDDGDITTLRRTALCLKSGRHFAESETLDQLPLTHPEHFGNPVIGGRRGRRSRQAQDESSDDEDSPPRGTRDSGSSGTGKEGMETEPEIGRVVCVELGDKKKKDNWFPGLVVAPTAQDTVRIRVRDDYLVRSFKDARYYTVPKKEATEFTKELVNKVENSTLKVAVEKALLFLEKNELPPHWDRDSLFGHSVSSGNSDSDGELDSDSSDDEPREEKDHFVAQLYKFMDDRGTPINNCPMIGSEDIDLYRLFRAVYKLGGYNRVTNQNQWKLITRRLSFTMQNSPSTHNLVKQAYKKFLHSFEDFYRKLGCTMVNHPRGTMRKQRPGRSLIRDKDRNTPVPPQVSIAKNEKEEEDKKIMEEEKKEKKEAKKESINKEEEIVKIKKKDEFEESGSGQESDVNIEGEAESSSSEKSQKISTSLSLPNRGKSKNKEDSKKKVIEKKKNEFKRQEKKDDKIKEEDATKTRSKSKDDNLKGKTPSENRETRTPSRESERKTLSKQRRLIDEDLKRRGRKRKEYEVEKSRTDEQLTDSAPCYKGPVELGDRLKVYYGPTHESKVTYEAKIIDMEKDGTEPMYLVHYTGWNTRYDEWIKPSRIAQNFTQAQGRVKRIKATSRPQTPSTNLPNNINKSSKMVSNTNSNTSQNRRRAQSVAPTSIVSSSTKEVKREDKDKEISQPVRSTTPLSVISSSSRTKSPATPANNRQTRTRNNDISNIEHRRRTRRTSGHADIVPSETEESETYDSDTTESEQTRTKSKTTEERKRREARYRVEDRIKPEEISEGEEDKDNLEEPRRGRRLRRTISKSQGIKSEPDSDEEQPKGRDFDLNQIRSELKGFDKAVKLELVRVEPDPEDEIKIEEKENVVLVSPKSEKNLESSKLETMSESKIIDNTEDIYEFKEPEPFEFEVRNKRDTSGEKDKIKKRVFEDEPKSPKKKQKIISPVIKETKSEIDIDSRKKVKKLFSKRVDDITDNLASHKLQSTSLTTCEEAFDKLCESPTFNQIKPIPIIEETNKISNGIDLLFSDLPGDDDATHDDSEDRLIISEAEVSEAEQENLFTYQQEMFSSNDANDSIELNKEDSNLQIESVREDTTLTISNKSDILVESKEMIKSPLHSQSPELKSLESKLLDITPVSSPIVTVPAPISARLPATSTIEEKLSAAMAFRNKTKDIKKEEEISEVVWKSSKEICKKLDIAIAQKNKEDQHASKIESENKKQEDEDIIINNENQCKEIMCVVIKQEEEELQQFKLKKEIEIKKFVETKVEHKKIQEEEEWKCIENDKSKKIEDEFKEHDFNKEKEKEKHKKIINQDVVDSADSSDSEQRLIIDNEESQDIKTSSNFDVKLRAELDRLQDTQERYSQLQTQKPMQSLKHQQQECEFKNEIKEISITKTDEEGETINSLLCEEEIPGSPAPIIENIEQINAGPSCSPPKVETTESNIVLMEMPFASAPTSGQSTTSSTVATLSMALPKTVETSVPVSLSIQQNPTLGARQQSHHQHLPALMSAQRRESNEAAPVMDNTPPTTPDSSISNISGSPREERTGGSSPTSEDNMKHNRDSSEADNDSGGKGPGFSEDDTLPNVEGNSADRILKPPAKRSIEETQSPKKRKRSRKHSECDKNTTKKTGRHSNRHGRHGGGSDSDDTSEGSNLCGVNSTSTNHTNISSVPDLSNYSSRSPRPTKYNFYVELDPELDGSQRIAVLQQKLAELRKTYNAVKVELAAIERRRKKLRRREREDDEKSSKEQDGLASLCISDVDTTLHYVNQWVQRQCMCCYREIKNFDRFIRLTQSVVLCTLQQLQIIQQNGQQTKVSKDEKEEEKADENKIENSDFAQIETQIKQNWSQQDREKLFHLLSKIFLLNFPLYIAMKHSGAINPLAPVKDEGGYCEPHDPEVPAPLIRAVSIFCHQGGFNLMSACFDMENTLPVSLAHSMVAVICNLKLWLNYGSVIQLFIPLRSRVMKYMCRLADKELRTPAVRTMADFMWSAVKDPIDAVLPSFDRDGLDLAFKYFTSTTLTMRLAGIAQINAHITAFNELCNSETVAEVEQVGHALAAWLTENNIIAHIFGPNLHVEVIKQSHIVLSFLAMEGRITCSDMDTMWQAAQLKHCGRPVYDLLAPLVKHLAPTPVLHLYSLLGKLEPKDHTEQSLFLASALIKFIWTAGGSGYPRGLSIKNREILRGNNGIGGSSTSDPSGIDGSSPDEDEEEPSPAPSEGPSPRKQARGDSSDGEGPFKAKSMGTTIVQTSSNEGEDPTIEKSECFAESIKDSTCNIQDDIKEKQSGSDAEADTEKSNTEETVAIEKRKKKVLRKRKKPQKRSLVNVDKTLEGIVNEENNIKTKDLMLDMKYRPEDVLNSTLDTGGLVSIDDPKNIDALDRVKQQAMALDPSDQQVPTTATLLRRANKNKYMSLVAHNVDRAPDSADTSHDEDDSDVAGVLAAADGPGAVISELAGLVHATGPTFLPSGLDEMLSDEEGSYSSRISNKSEKNMADFDGEESGCEEELAQLAARHLTAIQMQAYHPHHSHPTMTIRRSVCRPPQVRSIRQTVTRVSSQFNLDTVCKAGNTLLWDLLQDDKIGQLGEGLALEAEKALCNLLCFNVDRLIPMKFIEGCLENLATNRSVVVSLRLLPKLLASFQQFGAMDAHTITTWADRERGMMKHFFNNLKTYTSIGPKNSLYSHQTEIQVRLQFLSSIFSPLGSPDCFRLSLEQVDILWQCLSQDSTCADELFSWLLSQAKSTEQHALGMDTLKHLCMRKLPSLPPETISMTGLSLFQQLCNLARLAAAHLDRPLRDVDSVGMDFLWRIALKAKSTDVSMAAIQYLNGYYMSRQLTQEAEFVSQCMTHLAAASADLEINEEASLRCIQRALLLLRTHLEAFRKRYAYHLRRWILEGRGAGSHVAMNTSEKGQQLRIFVQPAGIPEKTSFTLLSTDYVADLRAEVAKWWDDTQNNQEKSSSNINAGQNNSSVLGSLLTDGPIRMITQGQELTIDFDEKTLQEMGFKDGQLVFISPGAGRGNGTGRCNKRDVDSPSLLPPPPRESLPTLLLLRPQYFEQLFTLMRTLSAMKTIVKGGQEIPHTKAQVLSRRVWDTLTLLPTSPTLLRGFQKLGETTLLELLDPASPQKLMYSLYIVESLSRRNTTNQSSVVNCTSTASGNEGDADIDDNHEDKEKDITWSTLFVQHGGLRHLFDIFMSGCLEQGDGSEWQQDCLASLLKQLCYLGVIKEEKKRSKADKLLVPKLSEVMLSMMNVEAVMSRITNILNEASLPRDPNHYKTGLFGRSQVIHYTMALLVCWVHSNETVKQYLFSSSESFGKTWLRRLVLEDPEPAVRREVCTALYKLCLGTTGFEDENSINPSLIVPMLNTLLEHLVIAEAMQPSHRKPDLPLHLHPVLDDGKEPYGPACRDYFWLICRLVDSLPEEAIKEGSDDSNLTIDLEALAIRVIDSLLNRDHLETRHNTVEDDGLVGLLNLTCNIMTHNPPCKQGKIGQNLLHEVFDFLFALPNPRSKHVPKCKSQVSRSAAFDLLVELVKSAPDNYRILHEKLLIQHKPGPHSPYPWDYWPHEDGRSDCGYVGLTNLGATCYMASCMQHLYMMPQARVSILGADCNRANKHQLTLRELQRMFAYLLESERKAYNPRSFCRVYTMNHEPLNTGEQKDMAEFFIDLVSKLEEMTSDLKNLVKTLFCGVISNNVVSLDCEHVSRTLEEFYTVRCQVADMRNLYESLDEVTVKDTLEGDNMYTCSQCGKKARAEKRACFKKLPHILCFNTMRYTFNMGTMSKEKVNTHFSFPLRLDMSGYVEKKLIPQHYQEEKKAFEKRKSESDCQSELNEDDGTEMEHYQYDLIGVTVHTGTADGGHYYSFIRDRTSPNKDKWFLFNDAEVKPFDPNQIAAECFGGEMTSKTYDSVTDKFMDFSFEKTNSAYMLFYEWCTDPGDQAKEEEATVSSPNGRQSSSLIHKNTNKLPPLELNKELEDWIWQDNMHFLQDKNIFEHTYFTFMWQICGYIPQTLFSIQSDITEMSADLSTSFFMETFIHAKEKPTMVQWVELLTKQFNGSAGACARFLEKMAGDSWWPIQILVKCPNQMVRQMFQRLCIHVIQRLRATQAPLYLLCDEENDVNTVGTRSCVTRFVRMLLSLMEHAKQHLKHLTEYFSFLYEFSKMGEEETLFLIRVQAISTMINFYLGHKTHEFVDAVSEEEEEEEVVAMPTEKLRPASLDKMITLIATLVERSRGSDHRLSLSPIDLSAVAGGKGFPFLYQQTRDVINLNQTRNLIQSLCRWNDRLAIHIITMIFQAITKHTDVCQPFFKLLTLLTESSGLSGLPCMTQLILGRVWEAARVAPHGALEWLALAVTRSKLAHAWVLQGLDTWLQHFLLEHSNQRVRSAAAFLLVSLVPSTHFRQGYRSAHRLGLGCNTSRELQLSPEATLILHKIYTALLRLLQPARHYIDIQTHGTMKLTAYFALLTYCVISKTEKLMFGQYLNDLWTLFHPKLSEPSIPVHHNKQAVLLFWYHVCSDCPENVALILHNPHITKNIAFNYILADHEDQDVVLFNRVMLPAYYGLLRLCCQQSRTFTRQLAAHQNIQWAFKNITPHPTQYSTAVDELFKLMQLLVARHSDQTEQEEAEIASFRRGTLSSYLQGLDGRSCWATLISAFRILIESDDDRLYVVYNGGLSMALEAFHMLHIMYHEATACHVAGDLAELIAIIVELIRCIRTARDGPDARNILANCKEWPDILRKLATLLNTYNPPDMRNLAIDLLKELVMLVPAEAISILAPLLSHCHAALQESHAAVPPGPYLPRRSTPPGKMPTRPARPMVQMAVPHSQLEASKGVDPEYDNALLEFYLPYHELIDVMCRLAINNDCMTDTLVNLSAMLGFEGVPLHLALFPRLWLDVHAATHIDRKHIASLLCSSYTVDYVDAVLLDERSSLGIPAIHAFLKTFFPKLANHVLTEQTCLLIDNLVSSMVAMVEAVDIQASAHRLTGDLRALALVYNSSTRLKPPSSLLPALETLLSRTRAIKVKESNQQEVEAPTKKRKFMVNENNETNDKELHLPIKEFNEQKNISNINIEEKDKIEVNDMTSSDSGDDKTISRNNIQAENISTNISTISPSLIDTVTSNNCTNQLRCSLTNVSWFEMLEKTILDLQTIVQLQAKNN